MRRRNNKVNLYLNDEEIEMLRRHSKATGLNYNSYLRHLIKGYVPRESPDDRFWSAMGSIREFADKIDEIAKMADTAEAMISIMAESKKWRQFQNDMEKEFLLPKRFTDERSGGV